MNICLLALFALVQVLPTSRPPPPPDPEIVWRQPVVVCFPNYGSDDQVVVDQVIRAASTWRLHSSASLWVSRRCNEDEVKAAVGENPNWLVSQDLEEHMPASVVQAVVTDNPADFGSSDGLGNVLGGGRRLRFAGDYDWRDPICGDQGRVGRQRCVYADAVHELGHLLGLRHDHVSVNSPHCAGVAQSRESTDRSMSYYDARSIMNYCNLGRYSGLLSEADICAIQVGYPVAGRPPRTEKECEQLAARTLKEQ